MTGYVIERSDVTRGGWVTVGSTDSHTFNFKIPKLLEGNKYYFRVMAENAVGTGKPLETFQAVEVKSPYGVLPVSHKMSILIIMKLYHMFYSYDDDNDVNNDINNRNDYRILVVILDSFDILNC